MGLWTTELNLLIHFFIPLSSITSQQASHLHYSAEITQINYHLHLPPSGSNNSNTLLSTELQNVKWTRVKEKLTVDMIRQEGMGRAGVPPCHAAQHHTCPRQSLTFPCTPASPDTAASILPLLSQTWEPCSPQGAKQSGHSKEREWALCFPPASFLLWGTIFV